MGSTSGDERGGEYLCGRLPVVEDRGPPAERRTDRFEVGVRAPHAQDRSHLIRRSAFRVRGAGCRVQGSGLRVQGSGFVVEG